MLLEPEDRCVCVFVSVWQPNAEQILTHILACTQAVERMGAERLMCLASEVHLSLRGSSASEAQVRFIHEALAPQHSSINLQLHRLQRVKKEATPSAWLGVGAKGIDIFEVSYPFFSLSLSLFFGRRGAVEKYKTLGSVR
jgi:hypothetical protein